MTPISYPARPRQGGPLEVAIQAGAYRSNDVRFQPKYNGWRAMLHTPTGAMFNRHGEPIVGEVVREFSAAVAKASRFPFEWLDVEALERRHEIGKGALIVLDWIVREPMTFAHRRRILELTFPRQAHVGMELFIESGDVLLVPDFDCGAALTLWERLPALNAQLACTFYEGVVSKTSASIYPIQLRSSSEECLDWIKHRFTTR